MSAAPEITRSAAAPAAASRPPAKKLHADAPALARRVAMRLGTRWVSRATWIISRTGWPGLVGIALLLAAAVFLFSTHLEVAAEVQALRAGLAAAQSRARTVAKSEGADPATAIRVLPARADMPAILHQLFDHAMQARLAVDTARYEINATGSGGVVRHHIAFPVTGPYPQIRAFIDTTLATMPAIAVSDLVLDRKSIADGRVEAQIRMTAYTAATGAMGPPAEASAPYPVAAGTIVAPGALSPPVAPARQATSRAASTAAEPARAQTQRAVGQRASKVRPESHRVVASAQETALFAQHSWYVLPPPPPPAPVPPPPVPTAPPFPFTFIGSFSPEGHPPVYFLAQGERVIDAHVGDRIDGVYQFESAAGGQLVFVYLPLDVRQTLAAGASQ